MPAQDEEKPGHWTLNALAVATRERGIEIGRSQVRRMLKTERVRWRAVALGDQRRRRFIHPLRNRAEH